MVKITRTSFKRFLEKDKQNTFCCMYTDKSIPLTVNYPYIADGKDGLDDYELKIK